ncbi:MFS transporter [bacterium]|nr:MFS transporter [bacterium]
MSKDLKVVSAAMLTWGIGEGMFYIFQPIYLQQLGADPILIGTLLGISGLMMSLAQIPSGYLADRLGRRPLMWFSWVFGVVSTWVMALAPSLTWFVVGMLLYSVTSSAMPPLNTYVQGARGKWSVGRAVSFTSAAYNIGGIIGPLVGGMLGEGQSLKSVYAVAAVIFTISTVIIFFASDQEVVKEPARPGEAHLLQNKRFLSMLVVILLVMFAVTLPQPLAANFLQNQRQITLNQIGRLGSLSALGSVVLVLAVGHLPAGQALLIGQAGLVVFAFLLWQGQGILWYGVAYFFMGGFKLSRIMTVALVRPVVREREVGLAFGMVETLNSLAAVFAPVVAGLLYDWRPISIFPVGLLVLGATIAMSLRFARRFAPQPEPVALEVALDLESEIVDET